LPEITLPHNWTPREYQRPLWDALEGGCKRAVAVWHRRAGKDMTGLHWTAVQAFVRPGIYWHLFPSYAQGRKAIWEGRDNEGHGFLDAFPEGSWFRKRDDEMSLWLHGGSIYQVIGCDQIDRLVGANPVGCVFSEYSLQNPAAWQLIRPILANNNGWAIFAYTPRGRNHGYKLLKMAEESDKWFSQVLTVDDTNVVSQEIIDSEKAEMPKELFEQEYYCSFDAPLVGAYFGELLSEANKEGRISKVPWVPEKPVVTGWDLGMSDSTSIWFAQRVGSEVRLIDYYESSGQGLEHYAKVIRDKPYVYEEHLVPHDAQVRELGTGKSRMETAMSLGLRMRVVPKLSLEDGIQATRLLLRNVWLDESNCARGFQALREYVKAPIENERGPDGEVLYRDRPKHNWASHAADALRTLAVGMRRTDYSEMKQPDIRYVV
jgi:phage terminase large subunit